MRFPGQYFDAETGLNYNYFRDYEAGTGRYVESDPVALDGGVNTYAYAGANSLTGIDPLGLLTPGKGCDKVWARIKAAEDRIRRELDSKDGCITCKYHRHEHLLHKLDEDTVNCEAANKQYRTPDGKRMLNEGGEGDVDGHTIWLYPDAFLPGIRPCLTAIIYHELLHNIGKEHPDPNHPDNPNDPVNSRVNECKLNFCGSR